MKIRKRVLLLASLLLLVSVGGIVNLMWQMPHIDQMQDPKAILQILILLGLFGAGLVFSILELVQQEIRTPVFQLTAQIARLRGVENGSRRLEFTGNRDIDLLTNALNDLMDGFEKNENLYRIFAETSPDMIFLLDEDGCVLFGNKNAAQQWNFQPEEIIGKRQEDLFPPDIAERHKQVIQKIFATGQPVCIDVHEKIGERHCWIDARMIPVCDRDDRVTAVLGIFRDITERVETEQRKDNLIRDVSHSLKSPIATAEMALGVSERGIEKHDLDRIKKAQNILTDSLGMLHKDVDNILAMFSLGEFKTKGKEIISLEKTINNIIDDMRHSINPQNVEIIVNIHKEADRFFGEQTDIRLLLLNIMDNAIKFTPQGNITLTAELKDKWIEISLKDTGRGINSKDIDKIFDRFYKCHPAKLGTGLGLPICKEIVRKYNGTIKAISAGEEKGTTVIIRLPKGDEND